MEEALQQKIDSLPAAPGVYLMKDGAGRVIYVGKAVDLRARVRSYFAGGDPRAFVPLLGELLADVETVVVENDKEALLLENELIRRHRPRFNLTPREGTNFVYLRVDPRQRYPRLEVTRQVQADGARYFGPYPLARALRETLRVVNRHFKLRTCADHDPATHQRPCLLCQISRFPAPSVYDIPPDEYRRHVEDALRFLAGKTSDLVASLEARMKDAAAALRFEEAARLRDALAAIERTIAPQTIVGAEPVDQDAFGCHREGNRLVIYVLHVRQGRVIGGRALPFRGHAFPERELLASFLGLYYDRGTFVPDEVLLPCEIDGAAALAELLSERKGMAVRVLVPARGPQRELVRMSIENAREAAHERPPSAAPGLDVLERLRERLGLVRAPRRIESFDVSHFHGGALVASKVAMTDGVLDKDRYRRYRIASVRVGDDYAAMYEVVSRRLRRGLAEQELPDLLVIDGGRGQLASARAAMKDLGVTGLDAIALAKSRERHEGEPAPGPRKSPERIYVPNRREPIVLPPASPEMLLLARLRDEAHRFAIAYQRKLLRSERVRSELEDIPGIGVERRTALLRHFGSLEGVGRASVDELSRVEGIGPRIARTIHAHLHRQGRERRATALHLR